MIKEIKFGFVAQLGERCVRNAEVVGSTPIGSIVQNMIRRDKTQLGILEGFSDSKKPPEA